MQLFWHVVPLLVATHQHFAFVQLVQLEWVLHGGGGVGGGKVGGGFVGANVGAAVVGCCDGAMVEDEVGAGQPLTVESQETKGGVQPATVVQIVSFVLTTHQQLALVHALQPALVSWAQVKTVGACVVGDDVVGEDVVGDVVVGEDVVGDWVAGRLGVVGEALLVGAVVGDFEVGPLLLVGGKVDDVGDVVVGAVVVGEVVVGPCVVGAEVVGVEVVGLPVVGAEVVGDDVVGLLVKGD